MNPTIFAACSGAGSDHSFLSFPTWYQYLPCSQGSPVITSIGDVWLIVAAGLEILLRVAAILAVCMIIYGGFALIISEGDPEKAKQARNTIIYALVGLAISVTAAAAVAFIAGSVS